MKKILITGISSFIGSNLAEYYLKKGYIVYGFYRPSTKNLNNFIKIKGLKSIPFDFNNITIDDINNLNFDENIIDIINSKIDYYFHFAWDGQGKIGRDNKDIQMENVNISKKSLLLSKKMCSKKFIFSGSQSEYNNTYHGIAKKQFFDYLKSNNNDIQYIHLKIFSVYGYKDRDNSLISLLIKNMLEKNNMTLGSCKKEWNYIYIDDLVKIIFELVEKCDDNIDLDIASEDNRPLKEYVIEAKNIVKSDIILNFLEDEMHNDKFAFPNLSLLKNIIKDIKFTKFEDGFLKTYNRYKSEK